MCLTWFWRLILLPHYRRLQCLGLREAIIVTVNTNFNYRNSHKRESHQHKYQLATYVSPTRLWRVLVFKGDFSKCRWATSHGEKKARDIVIVSVNSLNSFIYYNFGRTLACNSDQKLKEQLPPVKSAKCCNLTPDVCFTFVILPQIPYTLCLCMLTGTVNRYPFQRNEMHMQPPHSICHVNGMYANEAWGKLYRVVRPEKRREPWDVSH